MNSFKIRIDLIFQSVHKTQRLRRNGKQHSNFRSNKNISG